eukprot:TRINITY_DN19231_c0_g1_i1.p1 TRINITY_DN19231_c0_g1~~TRINITY_DN19231_c0_g1_i1.p1  ORF type:complete len:212 (-),score=41.71 TRINITY_DN19231_c0_g1_i1:420-1055(-)
MLRIPLPVECLGSSTSKLFASLPAAMLAEWALQYLVAGTAGDSQALAASLSAFADARVSAVVVLVGEGGSGKPRLYLPAGMHNGRRLLRCQSAEDTWQQIFWCNGLWIIGVPHTEDEDDEEEEDGGDLWEFVAEGGDEWPPSGGWRAAAFSSNARVSIRPASVMPLVKPLLQVPLSAVAAELALTGGMAAAASSADTGGVVLELPAAPDAT